MGCKRRIDEIIAWASMSAADQWAIVRDLPDR
jgi:predicted Fe-S protein YdhL (DUF1289 family)